MALLRRLAILVAATAVSSASSSRPAVAALHLGAKLVSSGLDETDFAWTSPLARGVLALLSTLLQATLSRAAALATPLTLPGQLESGSLFAASGEWNSSNLTVVGLDTVGRLSIVPHDAAAEDDTHLNASACFARLHTAMTLDARLFGVAARLRAEASVANVTSLAVQPPRSHRWR